MIASQYGHVKVVDTLLQHRAIVDLQKKVNSCALKIIHVIHNILMFSCNLRFLHIIQG